MTKKKGNLIAAIHIAKAQLGIDDDNYRAAISQLSQGRTTTSTGLTAFEQKQLLTYFQTLGWQAKPTRPTRVGSAKKIEAPQVLLIKHLWHDLHAAGKVRDASERALNRWLSRQIGVDHIAWIDDRQASRLIEALKGWLGRPSANSAPCADQA